jgi:hemolysin III
MIADGSGQVQEGTCRIEKNRSDHFRQNVQCENLPAQRCKAGYARKDPPHQNALRFFSQNPHMRVHDRVMDGIGGPLPPESWIHTAGEELANAISHGIGLAGAVIGGPILILTAIRRGDNSFLIGTVVFATTMLLVYLASTLYHSWPPGNTKSLLQVIDHAAIFLLIAGTYTPFTLGPLHGVGGLVMLVIVWALALFGVIMKATRGALHRRRFAMALYLGTGWIGIVYIRPLAQTIPLSALLWLIAGGIAYTVGTLFFAKERLRYGHFIWHLFVLTGSACHFAAVFICAM